MNDIATEAGIVRQTLYLSFPSKNAVLRAAIRHHAQSIIKQIERGWEGQQYLSEKLDTYFECSVLQPFQALRNDPDAEDLATGFNEEGRAEIAEANERFSKLIEEALLAHDGAITAQGQTVAGFAEFIHTTAHHLKYAARDTKHLNQLIGSLRTAVLHIANAN